MDAGALVRDPTGQFVTTSVGLVTIVDPKGPELALTTEQGEWLMLDDGSALTVYSRDGHDDDDY